MIRLSVDARLNFWWAAAHQQCTACTGDLAFLPRSLRLRSALLDRYMEAPSPTASYVLLDTRVKGSVTAWYKKSRRTAIEREELDHRSEQFRLASQGDHS